MYPEGCGSIRFVRCQPAAGEIVLAPPNRWGRGQVDAHRQVVEAAIDGRIASSCANAEDRHIPSGVIVARDLAERRKAECNRVANRRDRDSLRISCDLKFRKLAVSRQYKAVRNSYRPYSEQATKPERLAPAFTTRRNEWELAVQLTTQ